MSKFQKIQDKKEWLDLLDKALFKTFFHQPDWEIFLEKEIRWLKFERYLYEDKALLSLARYKIFGKERLISHPFCEYGGPLPLAEKIDFQKFQNDLFSEFDNPIKIKIHPRLFKYFNEAGIVSVSLNNRVGTYFIEDFHQKTKESLWRNLRKTNRHLIKKTAEQGVEARRCQNERELAAFYALHIKTVKRHKTIAYPFSFFKEYNAKGEIILAAHKGKIIAGSIFLFYDGFIHYSLNCSDEKHKDLGANHLILWSEIEKYAGKNYQVFDLGATRAGSGLEIFKEGWAAKKQPILELTNQPEENGLRESKIRDIFGLLPCFLIKKFSPYLLKYKLV